MRIVALADIHANLPALNAVLTAIDALRPDRVVVAGDVVNRGPQPAPCVELILERIQHHGWLCIRGNHEDFVLQERCPTPDRETYLTDVFRHSTWTCRQVQPYWGELAAWPDQLDMAGPHHQTIRCVHGSFLSNRDGLYPKMDDATLCHHGGPVADLLIVGHTHVPFIRIVDRRIIVNTGAVGLPFDRDPRASFAVLDWDGHRWQSEIVRVEYDRGATERAFHETGFSREGGPMVALILDELQRARPHLRQWHVHYEATVARGECTIEETVRARIRDTRDRG